MLTVIGFIEQENWMYAKRYDDDFCSHTSRGGLCEQHCEPKPFFRVEKEKKEKQPVVAKKVNHVPVVAHSNSYELSELSAWCTEQDFVTAERCQHMLNQEIPETLDQDDFFLWFRSQKKKRQEEIRRELMTRWYIEAAALKRRKQRERK